MKDYNIWTFTDASIARNKFYRSDVGVYGFAHLSPDMNSRNLFPWAAGFQAINGFDINILEYAAMYLALLDIRRMSNNSSFIIVTDSDVTYDRMRDAIVSYNGGPRKRWMETYNNRNALMFNIVDLYLNLLNQGYQIDLDLVKSHATYKEQRIHLFQRHGNFPENEYTRNVNVGNSYVDYYMSNIACNRNIRVMEQYGNDSMLKVLHSGYTLDWIR